MKKALLAGIVLLLIGGAVLGRRWWVKSTDEVAALAAGPAPAAIKPDSTTVVLSGRVSAGADEPLHANKSGRVRSIYFTRGDYVRRGAVLGKLADFTFINAPHDGFLGEQQVAVGQYVTRTTTLGTISKHGYLLVPVALSPDSAVHVQPGDSVRVWAAARPTRVVTGVAALAEAGSPAGTTLEIRLPSRAPLRIGETARVQLHR